MDKGTYYQKRTIEWFEKNGWLVDSLTYYQEIVTPRGTFFRKKDIAASDGMAWRGEVFVLWNSKLGKSHVSKARKKYERLL